MQVKSLRFKGLVLIALLINFSIYQEGAQRMHIDITQIFFHLPFIFFYIAVTAVTGLFSMGRIKKTGMHPILMTRPFATPLLVTGQVLGALISLLILLVLIWFPAGLAIRIQFGSQYPFLKMLYTMIFHMIPMICCVLAVAIWVRTCFKNNIVSIIILGFIFIGSAILASEPYLNIRVKGHEQHLFMPYISYFSDYFWDMYKKDLNMPNLSLLDKAAWRNVLYSLSFAGFFIMMSSYHLRRTEPQRKVLGNYGSRFYHTPTFLKIAFDLRIDPCLSWKHHLALAVFGLFAVSRVWPIVETHMYRLNQWRADIHRTESSGFSRKRYEASQISNEQILQVSILSKRQIMIHDKARIDFTFTCDHDQTDTNTVAILNNYSLWQYSPRKMTVDDNPLPYIDSGFYFIEGIDFLKYCDGKPHLLSINYKPAMPVNLGEEGIYISLGGPFFFSNRKDRNGHWHFDYRTKELHPAEIMIVNDIAEFPIRSPVKPERLSTDVLPDDFLKNPSPDLHVWKFEIPREKNSYKNRILFNQHGKGQDVVLEMPGFNGDVIYIAWKKERDIAEDLLDLFSPVALDLCDIYNFRPPPGTYFRLLFSGEEIRNILNGIKKNPDNEWYRDRFISVIEHHESRAIIQFWEDCLTGNGPNHASWMWDLRDFYEKNKYRGLNHRMSLKREYLPPDFQPLVKHLGFKEYQDIQSKSREKLLDDDQIPIFQMLYYYLGHEKWISMLNHLRQKTLKDLFEKEMVREALRETIKEYGEDPDKYDWFFDYWYEGEGFPCYRMDKAKMKVLPMDETGETAYEVEYSITNVGTGNIPVPVEIQTTKDKITEEVTIPPGETVTRKTVCRQPPTHVIIDPQGWILMAPYFDEDKKSWVTTPSMKVE